MRYGAENQTGYFHWEKHSRNSPIPQFGANGTVRQLQLIGVDMTRETLVKIERGIQHIQASQLRGIRDVLQTTYDELLK